jgi:hypothetical protein
MTGQQPPTVEDIDTRHQVGDYPYSVADVVARAAKHLGWASESGCWGVSGMLYAPNGATLTLFLDYEEDLALRWNETEKTRYFLEDPETNSAPHSEEDLDARARAVAQAAKTLLGD